ncbi:MAG TPA: hypothetical protein VHO84_06250 [Syntrophorhabdaceae bacterium]|nr:hypothetical protein [Syntrophorhabdaceae bacterium]
MYRLVICRLFQVIMYTVLFFIFCFTSIVSAQQGSQQQQDPRDTYIRLVTPDNSNVLIGKRPDVKVEFEHELADYVILLDGVDISQLAEKSDRGFVFKPVANLASGVHTMGILAKTKEGKEIQSEVRFFHKTYRVF